MRMSNSNGHQGSAGKGRQIKYRPCPNCGHQATLIVEIQEEIIHLDAAGKRNYYCTHCHHQFRDK